MQSHILRIHHIQYAVFGYYISHDLLHIPVMKVIKTKDTDLEIRKVQSLSGQRGLLVTLVKSYAHKLGIQKGDFLKCTLDGSRLVMEKAEL
jgi:hypothetical protein